MQELKRSPETPSFWDKKTTRLETPPFSPIYNTDRSLAADKDYDPFQSRESALKGIVNALNDNNIYILGINGMPGVGKTTLATAVGRQVKEEKLFNERTRRRSRRKRRRRKRRGRRRWRRKKEEKILIILDNVWEEIDLKEEIMGNVNYCCYKKERCVREDGF
ncbi:hypothetical protein Pint_26889 [Pistacia integerrima]|uniref:Uncharacterized protein n=1 Tax=Pistacia integerrima TaxID=434235 RepID=A0ACC0YTK8_9ROSI|nr:hypothetical protein Pint_26889 [Pistacia integerrima]